MTQTTLTLHAEPRELTGRRANRLRRMGKLPAVVYGRHQPPRSIAVTEHDFHRAHRVAGESTLIDLALPGAEPQKVLIQDVAYDPISQTPIHVDFRAVSMTERITAHIPITFTGEAPVTESGNGVLVRHLDRLEVEALPQDLVHEIAVPLAPLTAIGTSIHVRDLVIPSGITVKTPGSDAVVSIAERKIEEVVTAATPTPAEVEVVGKKGKEAEPAAAGEPAATKGGGKAGSAKP